MNSFFYYFSAYFLSATLIHMVYILNHDLVHFTAFNTIQYNEYFSMFCSLSTGVPYGLPFGKYHRVHHQNQGVLSVDPDLASNFEIRYFGNPIMKVVFIMMIPFFYTMRPIFTCP